jgi:hypothetical protein
VYYGFEVNGSPKVFSGDPSLKKGSLFQIPGANDAAFKRICRKFGGENRYQDSANRSEPLAKEARRLDSHAFEFPLSANT